MENIETIFEMYLSEQMINFFQLNHEIFFSAELSYYTGNRKAPYAYHHNQNLTENAGEFERRVKELETRGNVDSPESGMDALMQAIVCKGNFFSKLRVHIHENNFSTINYI